MAKSKLKDLKITKVDFVDAGANQQADVLIFKNKEGAAAPVAAEPTQQSLVKRFLAGVMSFAKREGIEQTEIEEIAKGCDAETFDEKFQSAQLRKTTDEIWDFCYFLQDSLCSIVRDTDVAVADKGTMMSQSLAEFNEAVTAAIALWASGTPTKVLKNAPEMTAEQIEVAKARLEAYIAKSTGTEPAGTTQPGTDPVTKTMKGVEEDMKIDKSKLTPEELATLEAIEKKAGIQDDEPAATDPVAKSTEPAATEPAAEPAATDPAPAAEPAGNEDIYKGLHPAVAAELKALRKRADEAEDRELAEVAKKYEIIGKKAEDLVPLFKSLKAAGNGAYDQMIAVLDASVQTVEQSGAFSEIGKSTSGGQNDAWAQIEKHAEAIQKSAPTMTWNQAIDKACEQHPELVVEYETNR
ncbi:MAG: hypothetical protein IKC04_03630 [Oscillospiraceae bacterium]|nr:hypothetical protein [Oscillospiraceae bacterium]